MATGREIEEQALALLSRKWDTSEPGYVEGVRDYLNGHLDLTAARDSVALAEQSLQDTRARLRGAVAAAHAEGRSYSQLARELDTSSATIQRLLGTAATKK